MFGFDIPQEKKLGFFKESALKSMWERRSD